MYYYMDIPLSSSADIATTFGSIKMSARGKDKMGTSVDGGDMRLRSYVLLATDLSKLNNINNAIDGSEAHVIDTGDVYVLCANQWRKWEPSAFSVIGTLESSVTWGSII